MKLDEHTLRLIAVGASIAANCQACLEGNMTHALREGIGEQEIADAIEVGKMVRRGAASKMDQFASSLGQVEPLSAAQPGGDCSCK